MDKLPHMPRKSKIAIEIIASCALAFFFALGITLFNLNGSFASSSEKAVSDLDTLMGEYTHSFELFEQTLQLEINTGASEDAIAAYLKQHDAEFQQIEGSDYDGLYLYYHGRYLYSWSTPYSTYADSGYQATERPWYRGAVQANGEIWFSTPYQSYANDYMLSTISRLQSDGQTVIAYDIKLGAIQQFAESLQLYNGSSTIICDAGGNIIGSTDSQLVGGNYLLTPDGYSDLIAQAQAAETEAASDGDREKTQKSISSLQSLQEFASQHRVGIAQAAISPDALAFDAGNGIFCYYHSNGEYSCITLVPLAKMMPTILIVWLALSLFLILFFLLINSLRLQAQRAKELRIKNDQLEEAATRADAANRAKSRFLAQMSHEIRTPMNAIIGLADIAYGEADSPESTRNYLKKIESSSQLLLSILNDILDTSAIEGGKMKIGSAPFDLHALLANLATMFREQADEKELSFAINLKGVPEEEVIGDELRVNQVLMNLLSNAIKFTPLGGAVDLSATRLDRLQDSVHMRFIVTDTGCGMSDEMLNRLFLPFEQESATTAREHGGSGLGLTITKNLVEMMGGSVQVESSLGKGTAFTVDLPFIIAKGTAVASPSNGNATDRPFQPERVESLSGGAKHPARQYDFAGKRILIAEDIAINREVAVKLLAAVGAESTCAENGEQALHLFENSDIGEYSCILMDINMPVMDGYTAARTIRACNRADAETIPIYAMTANAFAEDIASALDAGMNGHLAKPIDTSVLYGTLEIALSAAAPSSLDG